MYDWMIGNEPWVRLAIAAGVFAVMAGWELLDARRDLRVGRGRRWFANLGLVAVDILIVRLLFPSSAVGMALMIQVLGWGIFNSVETPYWLAVVASVVVLDLAIYLQHVMFHAVPALWRLHVVHHADLDFDVTTGIRFHPIEIVLSMLIKLTVISVLGPPLMGVLVSEVLLNALAMFNHANVRMPTHLDRILRRIIVTPDMHRVHHSIERAEHNTNFGFNFSCWDRLLGTYLDQPAQGHRGMTIGVKNFRDAASQTLPGLLAIPFARQDSDGTVAREVLQSQQERQPGSGERRMR